MNMEHKTQLLDRLPRGPFTVSGAAEHGVSHTSVYRMRDAGLIEKIGPGLYIAGTGMQADLDLLEASYKAPLATICLTSALARHELIDEIPSTIDLALPRGKTPPQLSAPVTWHIFDKATFDIGRSTVLIEGAEGRRSASTRRSARSWMLSACAGPPATKRESKHCATGSSAPDLSRVFLWTSHHRFPGPRDRSGGLWKSCCDCDSIRLPEAAENCQRPKTSRR